MSRDKFKQKISINTQRLHLRSFSESDVTQSYIDWLNDKMTNRFLESRYKIQDAVSVKEWVKSTNQDSTRCLVGIFKDNQHIGNLTFYEISPQHKCLRVGISIGQVNLRGQGLAAEALRSGLNYAFRDAGYNRVEAGIYEANKASITLFESVGFKQEAVFKKRIFFEGQFIDMLLYVVLRDDFLRGS